MLLSNCTLQGWCQYLPMPFIDQRFLDCSIYLYDSKLSAEDGENSGGSGCLVRVLSPPVQNMWTGYGSERVSPFPAHIYAVTNKHVITKGFTTIRLNTIDNKIDVLDLRESDWISHPEGDDLAVAPIALPERKHSYFPIDLEMFVKESNLYESAYELRIGAGDDTFMVGRFINHAGKQKNTPSLRFGSIAMLPFEKIKLSSDANYHMQQAFLVETRSISGFSGSPVFLYRPMMADYEIAEGYHEEGMVDPVGQCYLLGIDCAHPLKYDQVVDGSLAPVRGWRVASNTGMAIVIPAWRLAQLLNIERLVLERKKKDEQFKIEKEKEKEATVALDTEDRPFTEDSYRDALRRATQMVSESESK
jgi:hypothetical protein